MIRRVSVSDHEDRNCLRAAPAKGLTPGTGRASAPSSIDLYLAQVSVPSIGRNLLTGELEQALQGGSSTTTLCL
jgi:transcriptional regulator of nitric oxide reductase